MTLFSDLKLDPKVLQAIAEAGYETPTPIQAGAIPPALEGRDVLGIAQTGTGKTASFTLPMITLLGRGRARARMPRSLVLCPTRELAAQVAENFDIYAKHTRLTKALLIGGVSFGEQDKLIDRGVDVLIATPGRLLDHFERGKLLLTGVQIMVVDEADRMLDMGFIPDIERIFQLTPFTRQTLFFSATMAPEIERITNTFLHAPERIEVARQATTSETITQKLVELTPTRKDQTAKQKREMLRALIAAEGEALKNAIIFCNRKTEVDIVAKSLKAHGFDAAPIHGDLDQRVRMQTLDGFREGTLRFLVASDVAARGLDIPAVSHVFNFDLPSHAEDYVHRIGRTGRAGRLGTAISIATPSDEKYLAAIENLVKQTLPRADAPEGFSLSEAARSAPREPAERPERGRSRTRGRSRRSDGDPVAATPAVEDSAPAPREEREDRTAGERDQDRRGSHSERGAGRAERDERRDGSRRSGGAEARGGRNSDRADERGGRESDRREDRRGRDRDRGPSVVGMGDHVPDFLLTSFRPALSSLAAPEGERPESAAPERVERKDVREPEPAKIEATPATFDVAPEPVAQATPLDSPASDAVIAAPEAELQPMQEVGAESVTRPADAALPEAAEEPAPKPKRARAPRKKPAAKAKAEPESPVPDGDAAEARPAEQAPLPRDNGATPLPPPGDGDVSAPEAPRANEHPPAVDADEHGHG